MAQADADSADCAADGSDSTCADISAAGEGSSAVRGQLTFEVQDATALTYPDNSFDVVIIANALHTMPDPESALRQIRRVLRPGGTLYAPTFVQREGKAFKPWIRLISLFGFKTFNRWSAADFAAKVESLGFTVVNSSLMDAGISPPPPPQGRCKVAPSGDSTRSGPEASPCGHKTRRQPRPEKNFENDVIFSQKMSLRY